VEGIYSVKGEISTFIVTHGGIKPAIEALYRRLIGSDFIRKVAETFGTRILLIGIGLVTSVIVARILGPEGRGLYAVAATIGAIGVQFGNLGLHASNTYYLARDRSLLPALVGNSLLIGFVFGGLGAALAWVVFHLWPRIAPLQGLLLILGLSWIPLGLTYMLFQNLLLGIQDIRAYNKIELMSNILSVLLIGLLIVVSIVTVETVFCVGLIVLTISLGWILWRLRRNIRRLPMPSFALFKDNIRYGLKAYLAAFFAFLVLRIDMLMVQYMLGAEQTGYYSIAVAMADMTYMLPVVVGTILFPTLSAMRTNQKKWQYTKKVSIVVGIVMLIVSGFLFLLAEPLVRILYGRAFVPAVAAFIWLLPGIVMLSINVVFMNFFASRGMPIITVYAPCAAAILNIALNMKLIPLFGIVGASVSSSISYGLMLLSSGAYILFSYNRDIVTS
jgi:O-antigen/teichoic acid export membrane protein